MGLQIVVAACVVRDEKVMLVFHKKQNKWLLPGGHILTGETPDEAVVREVSEEVGMRVEVLNPPGAKRVTTLARPLAVPFLADVHTVGDHDHCCLYYLARASDTRPPTISESEVTKCGWFSVSELRQREVPNDVIEICEVSLECFRSILAVA